MPEGVAPLALAAAKPGGPDRSPVIRPEAHMRNRQEYVCSACGAVTPRWQGQCRNCSAWNTLEAVTVPAVSGKPAKAAVHSGRVEVRPVTLDGLDRTVLEEFTPLPTGLPDLDEILGGGLIPGAAVLLGGEPGIGKSTLFLQVAALVAAQGHQAVYVTGEESLSQIAQRAGRLGALAPQLQALASTRAEDALALLAGPRPPALLVIDSIQTMASEAVDGLPGSVGQVRAVSTALVEAAKKTATTLILVGHVTKEGQIAGPKLLEHMVDTVLYLEGDRQHLFRLLRVVKNRFGPSFELLVFQMTGTGMEVVRDPSTFFLGERESGHSGAALVMAVEGNRPFAVEVQALVSRSFLAMPRRTAVGIDMNRMHLLLAVIEKRLGLNLSQSDIYAKIGGGLALREPGPDLGLVAAVLSSFYDRPLPEGAAFWGEVDLNGRVRPVIGQDARLRQAERLGYGPIFHPGGPDTRGCRDIADLHRELFGRK